MSFSSEVKEELLGHIGSARHCQLAELLSILYFNGLIRTDSRVGTSLYLQADYDDVTRKFFTILKKAFNIEAYVPEQPDALHEKGKIYHLALEKNTEEVLKALHLQKEGGALQYFADDSSTGIPMQMLKQSCCKRAFLRDAFLCIGSMSDPNKSYHLEFVCGRSDQAATLVEVLDSFDIHGKTVQRGKYEIVYLKEANEISELLSVMDAPVQLMELENLRILKDVRSRINRQKNCDLANIGKTVAAATKQSDTILFLRDHYGFENLPNNLREMAEIRLLYPEASLQELGTYLDPPVGKSGVNHRLRKLTQLADQIRSEEIHLS